MNPAGSAAAREILILARAVTDAGTAGVGRIIGTNLEIVRLRDAGIEGPEIVALNESRLAPIIEADPEVATFSDEKGFLAGVAIADSAGGVYGVLFVTGLGVADPAKTRHLAVLGSQMTRLLDTREEQQQFREVSLTMSETSAMLASQLDQAERSNHDLENFAFIASHELRRPLSAISGVAEVLGLTLAEDQPYDRDLHRKALQTIEEDARRLQEQIDALLSISRFTPTVPAHEDVDLSALLSEAKRQLEPLIDATEAVVTGIDLGTVVGDSAALLTVIRNLVSNSLVYRQPGRRPVVDVSMERGPSSVTVSVTDNGIGLEPDLIESAFDLFRRGPTDQPGTGIGLAVCKRVTETHSGSIGVESAAGSGSTFWFTLPQP